MIEKINTSKIEEQTEAEYKRMVAEQKRLNVHSFSKTSELKFKPGKMVAVSVGETLVEGTVRKGEVGIYIVDSKNKDGTQTPIICTENTMSYWN